jgi:hypothetical protein
VDQLQARGTGVRLEVNARHCAMKKTLEFTDSQWKWIQYAFWWPFVIAPFIMGWVLYRDLPNERFDDREHELIESEYVDDSNGNEGERPYKWRHKVTGKIYCRDDFSGHRYSEGARIGGVVFTYGIVGCMFFAWCEWARDRHTFLAALRKATLVNLFVAMMFGLLIGTK